MNQFEKRIEIDRTRNKIIYKNFFQAIFGIRKMNYEFLEVLHHVEMLGLKWNLDSDKKLVVYQHLDLEDLILDVEIIMRETNDMILSDTVNEIIYNSSKKRTAVLTKAFKLCADNISKNLVDIELKGK